MDVNVLVGRKLNAVWFSHPRVQPHPAWTTPDAPDIQVIFVNLAFADRQVVHIVANEVEDEGRYPALGIEVVEVTGTPNRGHWYEGTEVQAEIFAELASYLPAEIKHARLWDSLGEGPDSALDLILMNGIMLRVRHILPPMILGVELFKNGEAGET